MWSGEPAEAWKNPACGPLVVSWLCKVVMTSVSQASHEEALTEWLRVRPQIQTAQVQIPAPPLNTWVTLGMSITVCLSFRIWKLEILTQRSAVKIT